MKTAKETAAAIRIGDLRTASNQIDAELAQTFAGVFAQHRTWRKAAGYTDALTACDTKDPFRFKADLSKVFLERRLTDCSSGYHASSVTYSSTPSFEGEK